MINFITEHWAEVILSLITAGSLGFCKYLYGQFKRYRTLLEQQDQKELSQIIEEQLKPIVEEIKGLQYALEKAQEENSKYIEAIMRSYRFRLIQLCKIYLEQGYMSTQQFEQLSELYKVYTDLHGNGQAKEYYDRTIELPIKD